MPGTSPLDPQEPVADAPSGSLTAAVRVPRPIQPGTRGGALGFSLAWLGIALGIGVAVGLVVGYATFALSEPSNGWADLAAVILGMFGGVVAAMVVWFVAMVKATRRFVPPGRRLGVLGWSAVIVIASPMLVGALFALIGSPGLPRGFVVLTALLAMVLAPTALVAARVPALEAGAPTIGGSMAG